MAAPAQQGSEPPVIKYEELGPDEDLAKPREVDVMAPEEPPDGERQPMGAPWRRMPQRPGGCVVGLLPNSGGRGGNGSRDRVLQRVADLASAMGTALWRKCPSPRR